jgi:hypothetical protein
MTALLHLHLQEEGILNPVALVEAAIKRGWIKTQAHRPADQRWGPRRKFTDAERRERAKAASLRWRRERKGTR